MFRRFLAEHADSRNLRLDISTIEDWIAWNRARDLSSVSVNTYYRALRPFSATSKGTTVSRTPSSLRSPVLAKTLPKAQTPDECRRILDATWNFPWRREFERASKLAIIGTMLCAGLRRGEVLDLHLMDINLRDGTLLVRYGKKALVEGRRGRSTSHPI